MIQVTVSAFGLTRTGDGVSLQHGIAEADVPRTFINAVRLVEIEQHGKKQPIVVGPERAGNGSGAVPADEADRIIHADRIRPEFCEVPEGR